MLADVIYPADLANQSNCGCGCDHNHSHGPVPPMPPPPPGYVGCWCPPPPMPPEYPKYPCPCNPPEEETPIKKQSREEQLCILSKKSAAINAMIEAFKKKNCDAVIKIGSAASYNFGPYYSNVEEQTVSEYGTSIMTMLENELSLIKAKISEVAQELGKEEPETTTTNGVLKTVTQD